MKYLKIFEQFNNGVLMIVDVQKSYRKFFSEMYLYELQKYCEGFNEVYQLWDNHIDGKNVDSDYLFDENPDIPVHMDLYNFPNQKGLIEKRYRYDVDIDFFKDKMSYKRYKELKKLEDSGLIKKGDQFEIDNGIRLIYIGNNHKWFECPVKLWNLLNNLKNQNKTITIVGGADSECLEDVFILAQAIGCNVKRDWRYIWSASHCPF